VFPSYAVTRAMSKICEETCNQTTKENDFVGLETTFLATLNENECHSSIIEDPLPYPLPDDQVVKDPLSHKKLIEEQTKDHDTVRLTSKVLPLEEVNTVPVCVYNKDVVLMRKSKPSDVPVVDDWKVVHQPILPRI